MFFPHSDARHRKPRTHEAGDTGGIPSDLRELPMDCVAALDGPGVHMFDDTGACTRDRHGPSVHIGARRVVERSDAMHRHRSQIPRGSLRTLLGAAAEALELDKKPRVNTAKKRTHSLSRQGTYWYSAIPAMREDRLRDLVTAFENTVKQHAVFSGIFGAT